MALALAGLDNLSGLFPGVTNTAAPQDDVQGAMTKYIAIPMESIKYKGSVVNSWNLDSNGSGTVVDGSNLVSGSSVNAAADATSLTGSFRDFVRGVHESAYAYTADKLTGNNAYTYWNEGQGSYQVYNATTLTRRYTTDLYYDLGPDQDSKDDVS